jgi:hypothetical protein
MSTQKCSYNAIVTIGFFLMLQNSVQILRSVEYHCVVSLVVLFIEFLLPVCIQYLFLFLFVCYSASSCKLIFTQTSTCTDKYTTKIATSSRLAAHNMRLALIDPLHFFQSINITHSLVRSNILYPGEAKRKPAVVPIAFLYAIKRNLKNDFGPDD